MKLTLQSICEKGLSLCWEKVENAREYQLFWSDRETDLQYFKPLPKVQDTCLSFHRMPCRPFYFYGKAMHKRFLAKQEAFSDLTDQVQETVSGIRVIKAFANEKRSTDTFKAYNREWLKTDIKASRITTLFPNIVGFAVHIGSLLIWGIGGIYSSCYKISRYVFILGRKVFGME